MVPSWSQPPSEGLFPRLSEHRRRSGLSGSASNGGSGLMVVGKDNRSASELRRTAGSDIEHEPEP